jgi:hypothetical protein
MFHEQHPPQQRETNPMKPIALIAITTLFATQALACTQFAPLTPLASHTVRTAPDHDVDVLWVIDDGHLARCSAKNDVPSCVRVVTPR